MQHQIAGSSDSEGVSLGKVESSDQGCRTKDVGDGAWLEWELRWLPLGRVGQKPSMAPGAEEEGSWDLDLLLPQREVFPEH